MPRRLRHSLQGTVFHVLNRAVGRAKIFHNNRDYEVFFQVVREGLMRSNVRVIAFCVMPNHWHFVVTCDRIAHLSALMHWTTGTHALRWHADHGTRGTGHLYQDRFKAVPVEAETSLLRVCRYVERNALRSNRVARAEDWPWSSLVAVGGNCNLLPLTPSPILRPSNWIEVVNRPETEAELAALRRMIQHNHPIGEPKWQKAVAPFCGLSLRPVGRPKKIPDPISSTQSRRSSRRSGEIARRK